jgi:hypothetical protein
MELGLTIGKIWLESTSKEVRVFSVILFQKKIFGMASPS